MRALRPSYVLRFRTRVRTDVRRGRRVGAKLRLAFSGGGPCYRLVIGGRSSMVEPAASQAAYEGSILPLQDFRTRWLRPRNMLSNEARRRSPRCLLSGSKLTVSVGVLTFRF